MQIYLVRDLDPMEDREPPIVKAFANCKSAYTWIHARCNRTRYYVETLTVQQDPNKEVHQ